MTHSAESILAGIEAMKDDYIRQLPKKAEELCALWQDIKAQGWSQKTASEFQIIVHSLTGTAATFELFEISNSAQTLDNLLGNIAFTSSEPSHEQSENIQRLFNDLLPNFNIKRGQITASDSVTIDLETPNDNNKILIVDDDAEITNEAKSDFISKMGHELRTPLNSILGFSQLLEMDIDANLTEQQKEHISTILNSGWHLLELINEIVDLSKIEAGKVPIIMKNIDIKTVVDEAISLAQKTSTKKNVTINNNVDIESTSVMADAARLRQVIVNILSNAVKYNNDNGHVDINIKNNHNDTIELSICDTGIGIPEHAMQELFTPFNRLGAEKSDVEGNGLGLAICQQLMKLMHGDIGAYNNPDAGSTFWLKLQTPSADINDNKQALAN